jgi:chromosome segregation ATPase
MRRNLWAVACAVSVSAVLAGVAGAEEKQQLLAELQAQLATTLGQEVNLKAAQSSLEQRMKDSDAQALAIAPQIDAWKAASARFADEAARYGQAVASHNARCQGTSPDAAFVNQCNNRKRDLDAWQQAAIARQQAIESQRVSLGSRVESIKERYQRAHAQHEQNAPLLQAMATKAAALQETIRRLRLDDSFLQDPRDRDRISRGCLGLSSLEAQVECMKKVFDGAR